MNLEKLINPKKLGIIAIICFIIYYLYLISHMIYYTFYLILNPITYLIGYLIVVLFIKNKNMKLINSVLMIVLILFTIISSLQPFMMISSIILNKSDLCIIGVYLLLAITTFGIIRKKKWPYHIFMYIELTLIAIEILGSFTSILNLFFLSYNIGYIAFILFMYLYGKSI